MKNRLILPALAIAALAFVGCSSNSASEDAPAPEETASMSATEAPTETAPEPTATTAPPKPESTPETASNDEPEVSIRGNLIKEVGDAWGYDNETGLAKFVVTGITVDPECTTYESENRGHLVKLDIEGENQSTAMMPFSSNWKIIDEDGMTVNGDPLTAASYGCIDASERLPNTVGRGEKVAGSILLDVPIEHGIAIWGDYGTGDGWEWEF